MKSEKHLKTLSFVLVLSLMITLFSGIPIINNAVAAKQIPIYMDKDNYTFEERAADLVSRLTLDEKIAQTSYVAPKIQRDDIYINDYYYSMEAVHGIGWVENVTSFSTSLAMAATWDTELINRVASAISDEARAMYYTAYYRLSYWSPTVNLARDPRWGRNEETYGEDPTLTSAMGAAFVTGMQGNDPTYLKTTATLKHFMANNSEFNRHNGNSVITDAETYNYYALPYKNIINRTNVNSVMTAYNRVNGTPMSTHTFLLDTKLRKTWGLLGHIVSDCGAVDDVWKKHNWNKFGSNSVTDAAAASLVAGVDLDCGQEYNEGLKDALNRGWITEEDITKAVYRLFLSRMRLGEWDEVREAGGYNSWQEVRDKGGFETPYYMTDAEAHATLESSANVQTALDTARQAITMLKNKDDTMPIDLNSTGSIALVGALADKVILGDYSGIPSEINKVSPRQGLINNITSAQSSTQLSYYKGENDTRPYLFNFQKLELLDSNDNVLQTLSPSNASQTGGELVNEGSNYGCIKAGSWVKFAGQTNLLNVAKVRAYVSVNNDSGKGGIIRVRTSSTSGSVGSVITTPTYTGGWGNYQTVEAVYDTNVAYLSSADLFLCFDDAVSSGEISQQQLNEIGQKDYAVVYVGMDENFAHEDQDRNDLNLPDNQVSIINSIASVNDNTIVFIQGNGCVDVSQFVNNNNVKAIFYTPHNGEQQGQAFADVITGVTNPGGKLPFTWINNSNGLDSIDNYSLDTPKGRTYMYYKGSYQYPFGFGLSYSSFNYTDNYINSNSLSVNDDILFGTTVTNNSFEEGSTVVQVYASAPGSTVKKLIGFKKVYLDANQSENVEITLPVKDLQVWNTSLNCYTVPTGTYNFYLSTDADTAFYSTSAQISGSWNEEIQTVTLETPQICIRDAGKKQLALTVSLDNDRIIDNGYKVTYSSSDPAVILVSNQGVISAGTTKGVATVTATVLYNGSVKSSSVAVASTYSNAEAGLSPDEVAFNGTRFAEFDSQKTAYTVYVSGDSAPEIGTVAPAGSTVTVNQINRNLPSSATVTVKNSANLTKTYTFDFVSDSELLKTDNFMSSQLDTNVWSVINPSGDSVSYQGRTGVTIKTTNTNLDNLVVQKATGDFCVETGVKFSSMPNADYQQGGLICYQDNSNYVKLEIESSRPEIPSVKIQLVKVINGEQNVLATLERYNSDYTDNTVYLKLKRSGSNYTAYYSSNGSDFAELSTQSCSLSNTYLGFIAVNAAGTSSPSINCTFKYFRSDTGSVAVYSGKRLCTDNFNKESFGNFWNVSNPNTDTCSYDSSKGLTITSGVNDLNVGCQNLFRQAADGDWTAETNFSLNKVPDGAYQQAGLTVMQDDINFIKVDFERDNEQTLFAMSLSKNGAVDGATRFFAEYDSGRLTSKGLFVRIVKSGSNYSGYYSYDGTNFQKLGTLTVNYSTPNVGIYCCKVLGSASDIKTTFKYFRSSQDPNGSGNQFVRGDIRSRGKIDTLDALLALRHSIGSESITSPGIYAADVNRNGIVDSVDALLLLRYSVELIENFDTY